MSPVAGDTEVRVSVLAEEVGGKAGEVLSLTEVPVHGIIPAAGPCLCPALGRIASG